MNQRKTISIFLVLLFSFVFSASTFAKGVEVQEAQDSVITITNSVSQELEANKSLINTNPMALEKLVRRRILPFIDFDAMSKLTLGKYWKTASPSQRKRFLNAYREMLVKSYTKTMLRYVGAVIKPGNSAPKGKPGYVTVRTKVYPKGGSAITANYDMRKKSGAWKAYNVEIAGLSLITNFRTNFTREIGQKGLDALITRLEKTKRK
ncbi:MAG TPA: ABC transporter substrate-binding protein [Leucothrix sp.]|nr:ABC transporter substrate-binding protein [Leucothrix sp.]